MNRRADRAWQKAEIHLGEGHVGDPGRGRQAFRKYVEERWLPNHMLEPTTREKHTYYLYAHIIPELGPIRMIDIFPEQIREWISKMQRSGQSAWTIQYCKSSILNSIFTTALNDQVTYIHPCRGVKTPSVPATPRTIVTPEQFNAIYQALPDADTRLLIETAIESGLRWGELTEMRVKDLDFATRMLTVCRKVAELNTQFHPDGKRFLVKDYPKDKEVPAAEAQPADRHQAQGSRRCQGPGTRRVAVRAAATGVATRPACCRRSGDARAHGVKRLRPKVSAWHSQRLQRGSLPVRVLQGCVRRVPQDAARRPITRPGTRAWPMTTSTLGATGSAAASGTPRARLRISAWRHASTTSGMRTLRGYWLEVPTSRWSRSALATLRL